MVKLYQLRPDILINLHAISLVIDRGYAGTKRIVRIYTADGQHEYKLSNEEWTRFYQKLEEYK